MSKQSLNLGQLFKQLQNKRNNGTNPLIPIKIDPFEPILFKNGVTVLTSPDRKNAAQMATFMASQLVKVNKCKILHVCLEEFCENVSINYISLFSNEKVRNLKNKNYPLHNLSDSIDKVSNFVNIIPVKNDESILTKFINDIESLILTKEYSLVIFEGVDKLLSTDKRELILGNLLKSLNIQAQASEVSILCAFKEEDFDKIEGIEYVKLSGNHDNWIIERNGRIQKVLKNPDYNTFSNNFKDLTQMEIKKIISSGVLKNRLCYGFDISSKELVIKNPSINPGAIFAGEIGSGKSEALKFALMMNILSNSQDTIYMFYDGIKRKSQFEPLFSLKKNVSTTINDPSKFPKYIDAVYLEMISRKQAFKEKRVTNIEDYNKVIKKSDNSDMGIANIILVIEEFQSVLDSVDVNFSHNQDTIGSTAVKIKQIAREGRSYGISFLVSMQMTNTNFSVLKPGFSQIMEFGNLISELNWPFEKEIKIDSGHCVYQDGCIQFPFFKDSDFFELVKEAYSPLESKILNPILEDFFNKK